MRICAHCQKSVTSEGKWDGPLRYCSKECLDAGPTGPFAVQISRETVDREAWKVHQGPCPVCGGRGPVDVHRSHWAWSALLATWWNSTRHVCCIACAHKALRKDTAFTLLLGWWGFPFGLIITPIQVFRNVRALMWSMETSRPSPELVWLVGSELTHNALVSAGEASLCSTGH